MPNLDNWLSPEAAMALRKERDELRKERDELRATLEQCLSELEGVHYELDDAAYGGGLDSDECGSIAAVVLACIEAADLALGRAKVERKAGEA